MNFEVIDTQEKLDQLIGERLARQKQTLESAFDAQKAELINEKTKTAAELKDATEKLKALQAEAEARGNEMNDLKGQISNLTLEKTKFRVAQEHGLSLELADRLRGTNEDELRRDAEKLSSFMVRPIAPMKTTEPANVGKDSLASAYQDLVSKLSN